MRIDEFHHEEFRGKSGWYAALTEGTGARLLVSRLDGETEWVVDGKFASNGIPLWVHGFGSRVTMLTVISDPAVVAKLNARRIREAVRSK